VEALPSRILVVEDSEHFRKFICSMLGKRPESQIVGEVTDGLEAIKKTEELQPDLVVLDIGLPSLNGIEVARRIRKLSQGCKILFVSQEFSEDIVREALGTGAHGYIVKTDAGSELLEGVDAVLGGRRFLGKRFAGNDFVGASNVLSGQDLHGRSRRQHRPNMEIASLHSVGFYSDDANLVDEVTDFIGAALDAGRTTIVVATESHRTSLLMRLVASGLDIGAAIEQRRYILLDAQEALSKFMLNGMPDTDLFLKLWGDLIATVTAATNEQARIAIYGECVHLLWEQGNQEAAIQLEKLGNALAKKYDVEILCGYCLGSVEGGMESHLFRAICAEHAPRSLHFPFIGP